MVGAFKNYINTYTFAENLIWIKLDLKCNALVQTDITVSLQAANYVSIPSSTYIHSPISAKSDTWVKN